MVKTLTVVISLFLFTGMALVDTRGVAADSENVPPICDAVRSGRVAAGITQDEVAERLGVSQKRVSLWETKREPSLDMIRRLEEAIEPGRLQGWLLREAGYVVDATDLQGFVDAMKVPKHERDALRRLLSSFDSGS